MIRLARSPILVAIFFLFVFGEVHGQQRNSPKPDTRPRTASISGRITISGKPAANAKVIVTEIKDAGEAGASRIDVLIEGINAGETYTALTDADGRYRVLNLPEGKYQANAQLGCCVRENRTLNELNGNPLVEAVSLDEGETRANVDFALVRGGVITGRVTDADGRPLIARVISLQVVDEKGQKQEYQKFINWEARQTDDRGVYRVYGLRAGRYLVSAGGVNDGGLMPGGASKYPRTWHPETADENQAKLIEVNEGGEVTGVDIRLGVAKKTYEAVGRVVDEETGKPVARAGLMCIKSGGDGGVSSGFGGNLKSDQQGNFRFDGLTPGRYQIGFVDFESFVTGKGSDYFSDGVTFEIQGADVSGLEIKAKRGATISGVAVVEDADSTAKSSLSQTMISAFSENEGNDSVATAGMDFAISRIGSDGGFLLKGVRPGKVTLNSQGVTGRLYQVVRIERDGVDVTEGIVVTGSENISGVRIVLGKGTCVIRGQALVKGGVLPEGVKMTVIVKSNKANNRYGGEVEVDDKGKFVINALMPGEYTLILMMIPSHPSPNSPPLPIPPVEQAVTLTRGQEAQVTMTIDMSKRSPEGKQ